ncbi:MAG: lipid A phosphate methyltransferase [Ignavibacteriae bacterium HGW-Ignavibacteriae-1]|jgi:protein-S-isoprenylcysteine O-methyltransferase Ste14|nr:MAG: lipid A phosphate methyltransferase [Ignavibacteriae bacterium HGW-Ignavibacteriae-1]
MALKLEFEEQGLWLFKYRGILPIALLFLGLALYLKTVVYPETFILRGTLYEEYYVYFCLLISLIGLAIRVYTVGFTPKNTSGRNVDEQVADTLNTTGIYSIVRHPLYLGNLLMWLGPALLTGQFWFVIAFGLFYWIYYERIMFAEEQFLTRKFGNIYTDWADKVPAFIPNFSNFRHSNLSFSWKKVLKQEKNGLVAVFLIFAIFDVSGQLVNGTSDFNYFLLAALVATGILYLVLRYLKNNTSVLNETGR